MLSNALSNGSRGMLLLCALLGLSACGGGGGGSGNQGGGGTPNPVAYKILATNDLGMHCVDADFSVFSILPPYNVVNAQVVRTDSSGKPSLRRSPYFPTRR